MRVYMFQPRFAPMVRDGTKRTTIRPLRRPGWRPKVGQQLSLRMWADKPYRSPHVILRDKEIVQEVHGVVIQALRRPGPMPEDGTMYVACFIDGRRLNVKEWDELARADGFKDSIEMYDWFCETHGLPFMGELIKW